MKPSRQSRFTFTLISVLLVFFAVSADSLAQRTKPVRRPNVQTPARNTPTKTGLPELTLPPVADDPAVAAADVAITARVRARELRFDVVPTPTVEFPCKPNCETSWKAERENLPTPVQPGVTYRDIGIRLKITSVFSDIDRIVAEALGEVPLTDDAKPAAIAATKKPSDISKTPPPNLPATTPPSPGKQR